MCQLLVGLPQVTVLGVEDGVVGSPIVVHIETRLEVPERCAQCLTLASIKDRPRVSLVDLPGFGRPARLMWRKRRWRCPLRACGAGSWTETAPSIAASRLVLTDRAGRWVTFQVGHHGRSVKEVASDLGCAWHTVNDAVIAYGAVLVDDPTRIGNVSALGFDETLLGKVGKWRTKQWSTCLVDVRRGQLLDVVKGRDSLPAVRFLADRGPGWCGQIHYATLDLSGPYRKVFDTMLPDAVQVADPLFRARKLLVLAARRGRPARRGRHRLAGELTGPRGWVKGASSARGLVRCGGGVLRGCR